MHELLIDHTKFEVAPLNRTQCSYKIIFWLETSNIIVVKF